MSSSRSSSKRTLADSCDSAASDNDVSKCHCDEMRACGAAGVRLHEEGVQEASSSAAVGVPAPVSAPAPSVPLFGNLFESRNVFPVPSLAVDVADRYPVNVFDPHMFVDVLAPPPSILSTPPRPQREIEVPAAPVRTSVTQYLSVRFFGHAAAFLNFAAAIPVLAAPGVPAPIPAAIVDDDDDSGDESDSGDDFPVLNFIVLQDVDVPGGPIPDTPATDNGCQSCFENQTACFCTECQTEQCFTCFTKHHRMHPVFRLDDVIVEVTLMDDDTVSSTTVPKNHRSSLCGHRSDYALPRCVICTQASTGPSAAFKTNFTAPRECLICAADDRTQFVFCNRCEQDICNVCWMNASAGSSIARCSFCRAVFV